MVQTDDVLGRPVLARMVRREAVVHNCADDVGAQSSRKAKLLIHFIRSPHQLLYHDCLVCLFCFLGHIDYPARGKFCFQAPAPASRPR